MVIGNNSLATDNFYNNMEFHLSWDRHGREEGYLQLAIYFNIAVLTLYVRGYMSSTVMT